MKYGTRYCSLPESTDVLLEQLLGKRTNISLAGFFHHLHHARRDVLRRDL